jgi:hypothetical protein
MREPWGKVSTVTYRLGPSDRSGLFLEVDLNWDSDCAGGPLKLWREHEGSCVRIGPDEARELRDALGEWFAEWDAIEARMGGGS